MRLTWWLAAASLLTACSGRAAEPDVLTRVTETVVAARPTADEDCVRAAVEALSPESLEAIGKLFGAIDDQGEEYAIPIEAGEFVDEVQDQC